MSLMLEPVEEKSSPVPLLSWSLTLIMSILFSFDLLAGVMETTLGDGSVMWAYFIPDVAGDYVMSLVVNTGLINSDAVTTTIHVLGPDSYVGSAVTELDIDGAGTMYEIYPTSIGLDEAGN